MHIIEFLVKYGKMQNFLEYLERALDWWNMQPPETENLRNLTQLVAQKPAEDTIAKVQYDRRFLWLYKRIGL